MFESEVGACGDNAAALTDNDDVEVGEEAQEIESVSVMYLYIQQELCQKRTLREWLRTETTRELRTVVNFFSQIVAAVEYVHSKKLIHRYKSRYLNVIHSTTRSNQYLSFLQRFETKQHISIWEF